ncbi:oxidoreductase [Seohaeicola zhoushanensis]|uniref:Oxidoreductase n=1 Tax=Seohaeicola zhoushanensis TaxID=1569283 RepID=A0A8J3GZM0_9RHOB|nr:oxidoreductase [Seohaeicola zhoushanensis]GHF59113.1 oxidoreductase [Seohaeicola zhoushanensis]
MSAILQSAAIIAIALASPLYAGDLPAPTGEILLTISGQITETNGDGLARFDRAMLETLAPVTIETTTIWTDGKQSFTGVPLARLMEMVGAKGEVAKATAINDYAVDIPSEDWIESGPIVAYLNNGASMSVRDKGPLWVIYPYDSKPAYQTEVIYSRSIWQLDRIEVTP